MTIDIAILKIKTRELLKYTKQLTKIASTEITSKDIKNLLVKINSQDYSTS